MASLGDIVIALTMDNRQFSGAAEQTRGQLAGIGHVATSVVGQIGALLGVGTAIAGIGFGVKLAADAEQTSIAFEVMLGSAEKAKSMLAELKAYSDRSPFGGAQTNEYALMLVNYGIAAENVLPTIRMLGDVAAGDAQKFEGLARAFGQMSATGRLMGGDLNQMINAGFNPLQEIAAATGESMIALKARMEAGAISSDEVAAAFRRATSEGGRFYGMTERQSQTLAGQWSTFRDELDTTLRDIGVSIAKNLDLKGVLQSTASWLGYTGQIVKTYGREIVYLTAIFASLVGGVAVARGAMMAYSAVQSILIAKELTLKALLGPGAWAQVAVGLAAAAATGLYLSSVFEAASEEARKTAESIGEIKNQTDTLTGAANSATSAIEKMTALQIRMKELRRVGQHSPELAQGLAQREFDAAGVRQILQLSEIGKAADKANPRVQLLRDSLNFLPELSGLIPAQQITALSDEINAALVREQDDRAGVTKAIAKQREELKKLEMGEVAYAAAKLKEAGASPAKLEELQAINDKIAAIQKQKEAQEELARSAKSAEERAAAAAKRDQEQLQAKAEQLKEATMTSLEKRDQKIAEINALTKAGLIDEETRRRALLQADEEYAKAGKEKKSGSSKVGNSSAALAGSSDAVSIMLRSVFGPDKTQANLLKQSLAEQKKQTQLLANNKPTKPQVANIA